MKCPKCEYNHPRKGGMKCAACGYTFTFDPKGWSTSGLTDGRFESYLRAAGKNDSMYFTRHQLYTAYCRKQKPDRALRVFGSVFCGFIAMVRFSQSDFLFGILLTLACLFLARSAWRAKPKFVKFGKFSKWTDAWLKDGKPIDKLIERPSLHQPPPDWQENDIYDYGVEKVLIVQRDELVDLFVLNNTHAQERALVIAESGYPEYLMPIAKQLLEQSPEMPVHLLHDATPEGQQMVSRVKQMELPLEGRQIVDLGLWPEDFKRMKRTASFDNSGNGELAVDVLPTAMIAGGLAACFLSGVTFAELLESNEEPDNNDAICEFG